MRLLTAAERRRQRERRRYYFDTRNEYLDFRQREALYDRLHWDHNGPYPRYGPRVIDARKRPYALIFLRWSNPSYP